MVEEMRNKAFLKVAIIENLRNALFVIMLLCGIVSVKAQTSLAGRVYHNPNILAAEIGKEVKDADKKMTEAKAKAVAKMEKEKGRKLTAAELAKIDTELEKARKMMEAIQKGMKTAITIEFKDATNMVFKADVSVSDDVLKMAGVSWIKRKAMKAALAVAPSSEKGTYVQKGNMIICCDGKDKDTLTISNDGKYVYGKFDKKTSFKLTRTK